ncbi:two component transcriptional regulator, LytTR family [Sphingomonas sp. OV641]|uniref:LytR/AlgR family response regulator transcription factor n=1 Tax=Sphingomonas sp. OV641 TaxID=1881068 RepID=UPI0008D8C0EE|nr:response regulator [Sphingomonas sp. OV641]SEJ77525.1 two component transcriptional regulator, LytTR family [Sphingomonas sp. OV641]
MTEAIPHIVLVDDEEDLREPTAAYLADQGLMVSEASGGRALDVILSEQPVDLVVLDVTMPEEDGFSIARRLRATGQPLGIVMLTARRDVIDRVVGLELGADDYLMKPFEPRELLARIRSVLRRAGAMPTSAQDTQTAPVSVPGGGYQTEFWIPTGRGQVRVAVEAIEWIEAAKDYALLHTPERSYMIRVTMGALETALDPAQLMRVHRSAFVRPDAVQAINQLGRHTTLVLKSGASVRVGPQHVGEVRHRLKR